MPRAAPANVKRRAERRIMVAMSAGEAPQRNANADFLRSAGD